MSVEVNPNYPSDLDSSIPTATDLKAEGDDNIRNIKRVLKATLPNVSGAITATHTQINSLAASGGLYSVGTSTSSLTIGTGTQSFTTQASLGFAGGQPIKITSNADSTAYMIGTCTTYNSTTGAMSVLVATGGTSGAGTATSWSITVNAPGNPFSDATALVSNSSDSTKKIILDASGITTATTRTLTAPDKSGTLALLTGDHSVTVHTGNGYGSTNTVIRRFTTTLTNTGTAITYADSAANGGSFTINEAGLYAVTYTDKPGGAGQLVGISLNSSQLTTSISGIAVADRLAAQAAGGAFLTTATTVVRCAVSDVIRAHTDGNPADITSAVRFNIRKVGA